MEKYFKILKECALFKDISEENFPAFLKCLGATVRHFSKNQTIFDAGIEIKEVGIVAEGKATISKVNLDGSRKVLGNILPGDSFGDLLAFADVKKSPLIVSAADACSVLFFPVSKIVGNSECGDSKICENLIKHLAQENIELRIKSDILSQKTMRDKLLAFLHYEADKAGSYSFKLSLKLEKLADFLGINRSAMSRELGNMKAEGIINYKKHQFEIHSSKSDIRFRG